MGYTTDFVGRFEVTPTLSLAHKTYLEQFSWTRRMKRDAEIALTLSDPVREAAGLPIGDEGEFFVGNKENFGQERDKSVIDYNHPPARQPGLWCQWTSTEDGTGIEWDGGEKFYHYIDWLEYIIENFLKPWGYALNGEVEWIGEHPDDRGIIIVEDNTITVKYGRIVYE